MSSPKLLDKFVGLQYPILMVAVFLFAYLFGQTASRFVSILTWCWFVYSIYVLQKYTINKSLKSWMTVLIFYILLTLLGYTYNGVPMMGFYVEFKAFLCPMLLVFVGAVNVDKKVYYWYLLAVAFCMIVGLYIYAFQPSWYVAFKTSVLSELWYADENLTEANLMIKYSRFSSFFPNIYPVSYSGTFAYCILINDLYKERKQRLIENRTLQISLMLLIIVGVLYTMVRVAFIYIILVTIIYYFYGIKSKNANNSAVLIIFLFFICVLSILVIQLESTNNNIDIERLLGRLGALSYDDMMNGSRTEQNISALTAWQNYLTGDGFGSRGGYARGLGLPGITDGGWTKMLVELGIVGTLLFLMFIFSTYRRACKSFRYYLVELSILSYGLIAMIGADTFSKGWIATIMWIAVGRIWNINYLNNKIITKDYV